MSVPQYRWPEAGTDLWQGCANAWECDEMGHQNVRFYVLRAMEGLTELLARAGMSTRPTISRDARARVVSHHMKMMREIRPGTPTHLRGGFTGFSNDTATIAQIFYHSESGEVSATFLSELEYLEPGAGISAPWPATFRAPMPLLSPPELCLPRGLTKAWQPPLYDANAIACGLTATGRGIISDALCDHEGLFRTEAFIALFADSTRILTNAFHRAAAATPQAPAKIGSAGVECRLRYHCYPRAGTRYVVRGGIADLDARTRRLLYCLYDSANGTLLAELQTLELLLDLDTRRSFGLDAQALHSLQPLVLDRQSRT